MGGAGVPNLQLEAMDQACGETSSKNTKCFISEQYTVWGLGIELPFGMILDVALRLSL